MDANKPTIVGRYLVHNRAPINLLYVASIETPRKTFYALKSDTAVLYTTETLCYFTNKHKEYTKHEAFCKT